MILNNGYPNYDSHEHKMKHIELKRKYAKEVKSVFWENYQLHWTENIWEKEGEFENLLDEGLFLEAREILAKEKKERIALRLLQKKLKRNASFGTYREWIAIGIIAIAIIVII